MPTYELTKMFGVTLSWDLSADSGTVIGLILEGQATQAMELVLFDNDGMTPLRTVALPNRMNTMTLALPIGQRRSLAFDRISTPPRTGISVPMYSSPDYCVRSV